MVLASGLEPESLAATDFKSVVYTNSTMRAIVLMRRHPFQIDA